MWTSRLLLPSAEPEGLGSLGFWVFFFFVSMNASLRAQRVLKEQQLAEGEGQEFPRDNCA